MNDELNIDPRETDYFDDYDMEKATNFFELKKQLADLGFNDDRLVNSLRKNITDNDNPIFTINCKELLEGANELRTWFQFDQHPGGDYRLTHFESLFSIGNEDIHRLFEPDISRQEVLAVLYKDQKKGHDIWEVRPPMSREEMKVYMAEATNDNPLKTANTMNTENLNYLQKQLLNLGFGDKLNDQLAKEMKAEAKGIVLETQLEFNQRTMHYTLHFRAGDTAGMYFFNKYDATLKHRTDADKDMSQTFYINKGSGITAKEAFNLMEGRAVHKQLFNLEGQKYQAWLQLEKAVGENGNRKITQYHENYGYNLENILQGKGIKQFEDANGKDDLLRSLRKGNVQQITANTDGKETKYFIAANPQFKTIDLYNDQLKKIKREVLLEPENSTRQNIKKAAQSPDEEQKKKQKRGQKISN